MSCCGERLEKIEIRKTVKESGEIVSNKKLFLLLILISIALISSSCTKEKASNSEKADSSGYVISEQVDKNCLTCHAGGEEGPERISDVRKTPEGWLNTVQRMERIHGVQLTDEQRDQIIKDLSVAQGITPEEAEPVQYWMANKPSYSEANTGSEAVNNSCISCHAGGRFESQRRTEQEWKNLKDFHLVMYPSIYLNNRHLDWPKEAEEALKYLSKEYPYDEKAWESWKGTKYDVSGKWKVVGYQATKGFYIGESELKEDGKQLVENKTVQFLNSNQKLSQTGKVDMFGGFMLRTQYTDEIGEKLRGTYNALENGKVIKGDWSKVADLGISAEETYYKVQTDKPEIILINGKELKRGSTAEVQVYGMNLSKLAAKDITLADGMVLKDVKAESDDKAILTIEVSNQKKIGKSQLKIKKGISREKLTVYQSIDYIKVDPPYGVARMGDVAAMQKVSTQYSAYAYSNGPDGKPDTKDDLKLMPLQATWSILPYPEDANADYLKFVGSMNENGLFTPLGEGVNPERAYTQENAGAATIHAKATIDGKTFEATSHHISTVPDYVNNIH